MSCWRAAVADLEARHSLARFVELQETVRVGTIAMRRESMANRASGCAQPGRRPD